MLFWKSKPKGIDVADNVSGAGLIGALAGDPEKHNVTHEQADKMFAYINSLHNRCHDLTNEKHKLQAEVDGLKRRLARKDHSSTGESALSKCFGLTRANFVCFPRVLMQEMPEQWQGEFADLWASFQKNWPNIPEGKLDFTIRARNDKGQMTKIDPALADHRHPHRATLDEWKCSDNG